MAFPMLIYPLQSNAALLQVPLIKQAYVSTFSLKSCTDTEIESFVDAKWRSIWMTRLTLFLDYCSLMEMETPCQVLLSYKNKWKLIGKKTFHFMEEVFIEE